MTRVRTASLAGGLALALAATRGAAEAPAARVLLVSIDGLHAVDLALHVAANPGSALAGLSARGVTYTNARTPVGDSTPGLLAFTTGGTPNATGLIYSPTWDRALSPPGSGCSTKGVLLTIDNKINKDLTAEDAGGGFDEAKLPRDPARGCAPVFPRDLVRTNTIFEVVKKAGGRTAWTDQHIAYNDLLAGRDGRALDDSFALSGSAARARGTIEALLEQDTRRVEAALNQIRGQDSHGQSRPGVPKLFGVTLITFSGVQKIPGHGYLDGAARPSPGLARALQAVDGLVGRLVAELNKEGLYDSTLVVVTAKHGQSPIDPSRVRLIDRKVVKGAVEDVEKGLLVHSALDTVGLLWLKDSARAGEVAAALRARQKEAGIQKVYSGEELDLVFRNGRADSRGPDVLIETELGVFYADPPAALIAEHGGTLDEDAHVALLLSYPGATAQRVRTPVQTTQVAPTVLAALGLDPGALDAVNSEGTRVLPGLAWAR